jgi:hypothetical protein
LLLKGFLAPARLASPRCQPAPAAGAAAAKGSALGSAFARLNCAADIEHTKSINTAIERGVSEAREWNDIEDDLAHDDDILKTLGFTKFGGSHND